MRIAKISTISRPGGHDHAETPVALEGDQAGRFQLQQAVAHRRAGDPERLGELVHRAADLRGRAGLHPAQLLRRGALGELPAGDRADCA